MRYALVACLSLFPLAASAGEFPCYRIDPDRVATVFNESDYAKGGNTFGGPVVASFVQPRIVDRDGQCVATIILEKVGTDKPIHDNTGHVAQVHMVVRVMEHLVPMPDGPHLAVNYALSPLGQIL